MANAPSVRTRPKRAKNTPRDRTRDNRDLWGSAYRRLSATAIFRLQRRLVDAGQPAFEAMVHAYDYYALNYDADCGVSLSRMLKDVFSSMREGTDTRVAHCARCGILHLSHEEKSGIIECPVCVLAASTPGDCFEMALEAVRIAVRHMVPVILLSDGYLANGSEPWKIPDLDAQAPVTVKFRTEKEGFFPYQRDPHTMARPWAVPGTPGLEHRIGGLEKEDITGNVSYDPQNHEKMVKLRAQKVANIANFIPEVEVMGAPEARTPKPSTSV